MPSVEELRAKYKIDDILRKIDYKALRIEILSNVGRYVHRMTKLVKVYDPELAEILANNTAEFANNPLTMEEFVKIAEWCHIDSLMRQASKGQFSYELICPHTSRLHVFLCAMIATKKSEATNLTQKARILPYLPHCTELEALIFKIPLNSLEEKRLLRLLRDLDPVGLALLQLLNTNHKHYTANQKLALYWADEQYLAQNVKVTQYFAAFLYADNDVVSKVALANIVDLYVLDTLSSAIVNSPGGRSHSQLDVLNWALAEYYKRNKVVVTLIREISKECIRDDFEGDPLPMLVTLELLHQEKTRQ